MTIRIEQWLSQFCAWHEQYRKDEIGAETLPLYTQARDVLCSTLVIAQRLEFQAGETRKALRVARAVPVEFEVGTARISALTQDISASGLSALVGEEPLVGTRIPFHLKLGRKIAPISGRCRVVSAVPAEGAMRMAVMFEDLTNEARLRIEDMVVDTICSEIRTMLLPKAHQGGLAPSLSKTHDALTES
jgi:hypothetical protein